MRITGPCCHEQRPHLHDLQRNGATVSISGTAIENSGLGAFSLNNASTAVIVADGPNTKVVIQGN